jgi:hypothetical protein
MPAGEELFSGFGPVSLAVIEKDFAVPWRHDCKYVVPPASLEPLAEVLSRDFLALEVDGQRAFRYRTRYFDNDALRCYHDHRQGRRRRYKVRVRSYLDSDLHFLEVKLKALRGTTLKQRRPYRHHTGALSSPDALSFVDEVLRTAYGFTHQDPLLPRLLVEYSRTTLVARAGDERVTIDRRISFRGDGEWCEVPRDRWIIECKGASRNGRMDALLRRQGHHPVRGCSKYCMGMGVTGQVDQVNRFLPAMRRLGCLDLVRPGSAAAAAAGSA